MRCYFGATQEVSTMQQQKAAIGAIVCAIAIAACATETTEARPEGASTSSRSGEARTITGGNDTGSPIEARADDAGSIADSGNTVDSESPIDAGSSVDSGGSIDAGPTTPSCPNGGLPLCVIANIDLSEGGPRPSDQCAPRIEVTYDGAQTSFTWSSPSGQLVDRVLVKSGTTSSARSYAPAVSEDAVPVVSPTGKGLTRITFCAP